MSGASPALPAAIGSDAALIGLDHAEIGFRKLQLAVLHVPGRPAREQDGPGRTAVSGRDRPRLSHVSAVFPESHHGGIPFIALPPERH